MGETPYSIDQESSNPILPTMQVLLVYHQQSYHSDSDRLGLMSILKTYWALRRTATFSRTLFGMQAFKLDTCQMLSEPNLSLPLTIGLFAKWGSGKSFLLPKICESMKSFSRSWLDGLELYWSWSILMICFVLCAIISLILLVVSIPLLQQFEMWLPLIIGGVMYVVIIAAYGFIYYGSEIKLWNSSIIVARFIARSLARLKLIISVATLNAPLRTEKEVKAT